MIRHGEKPEAPTDTGVDVSGAPNPACLTPQGWQRAVPLAMLFRHRGRHTRPDLRYPPALTRLTTPIATPTTAPPAAWILATDAGVSLVCWEHSRIPDIAAHIPVATGVDVPRVWTGDRFDVILVIHPGRR